MIDPQKTDDTNIIAQVPEKATAGAFFVLGDIITEI
jgi:hypothetical protein